jgi:hypothetical protein
MRSTWSLNQTCWFMGCAIQALAAEQAAEAE